MASPVAKTERLPTLDIVRGIAILMIVFVNVAALTGPQMLMLDVHANGVASTADQVVFYGVKVFVQGKFISIFALLFGMGLALQCRRLDATGRATPTYLRRQLLLMAMGVLHGMLLWWGDILFVYGVIGTAVFFLRNTPAKDLRRFATALIVVGIGMNATGLLGLAAIPPELLQTETFLPEGIELPEDSPAWIHEMFAADDVFGMISRMEIGIFGGGPLLASMALRATYFVGGALTGLFTYGIWVAGLMMLGVVYVREDFLNDKARQDWWITRGIGIGLAVELICNGLGWWGGFGLSSKPGVLLEASSWLAKPPFAIGVFALLVRICSLSGVLALFAPVGRLALTLYVGQSIVLNVLFAHWGLAWFGTMGRAQTFVVCVLLVLCQIVFAHLWLRFFDRGPLETVWRRLTYGAG